MKQLNEILDNPFPYKKTDVTGVHHHYEFSSGNNNYKVELSHIRMPSVEVGFKNMSDKTARHGYIENGSEKTHASRVYSTLKKIMKDHAAAHPEVKSYHFNGYTNRQHALYGNIIKKKYPKATVQGHDYVVPVNEIFDSKYPYKKVYSYKGAEGSSLHTYGFRTPKGHYEVDIHEPNDTDKPLDVSFSNRVHGINISNQEGKNAHRVFSTVHHIIKSHIKNSGHAGVTFTSSKEEDEKGHDSRRKLYTALANRYAHKHDTKEIGDHHLFGIRASDMK